MNLPVEFDIEFIDKASGFLFRYIQETAEFESLSVKFGK